MKARRLIRMQNYKKVDSYPFTVDFLSPCHSIFNVFGLEECRPFFESSGPVIVEFGYTFESAVVAFLPFGMGLAVKFVSIADEFFFECLGQEVLMWQG